MSQVTRSCWHMQRSSPRALKKIKKEQHVNTYKLKEVSLGIFYLSIYDELTLTHIRFLPKK